MLPDQFIYEDADGGDQPLPGWLRYHSAVGAIAGRYSVNGRRLVIAAAVPTRAYCAAFNSLGVVTANASADGVFVESELHFQRLRQLPFGAAVLYRQKSKKLKGRLEGSDTVPQKDGTEKPCVRIRVHNRGSGGLTHLVYAENAHKVEIVGGVQGELPKKQKGRRVKSSIEFVDEFFPNESLESVALKSRVLCAIVGRANALLREMKETKLAVQSSDKQQVTRGTLQDVVRIRAFAGNEADHFLADVVPVDSKTVDLDDSPPVVVFDGAAGFLKQRSKWPLSNLVVILDRTEPGFDDAVAAQNETYMKRRVGDNEVEGLASLPDAPPGVEIVAFEERCE